MIFFTGERTNFIIRLFSGLLVFFSWKLNKKFFILAVIFTSFLILIFTQILKNSNSKLIERYTSHFLNHIPIYNTTEKNEYWGAWRSGLQQGLERPIIGFGPSSSRHHCKTMDPKKPDWLPGKNYCGNHPHNFYFQLFSDTGLIGLFLGSLMFISIIFKCYTSRKSNLNCPLCQLLYCSISIIFSIAQMGNFYGQWSNLFLWF